MVAIPQLSLFMKGSSKRYYAFRNLDRLRALKRFNLLFSIIWWTVLIITATSGFAFATWLVATLLDLAQAGELSVMFDVASVAMTTGFGILLAGVIARNAIELYFTKAEQYELKEHPKYAKKYRTVMKVNRQTARMNLFLTVLIFGTLVAGIVLDIKEPAAVSVFFAGIIILTILKTIYSFKKYGKVRNEIEEIKQERQL